MTSLDNTLMGVTENNQPCTKQTRLQWIIHHIKNTVIGPSTHYISLQHVNKMKYGSGKWKGLYTGYINELSQPHYQGIIYYNDKDIYYGTWYNGKRHGKGIYNCDSGAQYAGKYKDDNMHGFGIYTFSDGITFNGEWRNGKQC